MPIVGPLRELGVHDVFQLLSLSRKTGTLRVTSVTGQEGFVVFEAGSVLQAGMRHQPSSVEDVLLSTGRVTSHDLEHARTMAARDESLSVLPLLIDAGAVAAREVERIVRRQAERVVFELMTWREGHFSFEEQPSVSPSPAATLI